MITQEQQVVVDGLDVASSRPVFIGTDVGNHIPAKEYQGIWNMTSNELACIASQEYKIIQHRAVVQSLFEAMTNLNLKFKEEVRTQDNRIVVDITFPETRLNIQKGEEFIGGLRLINSYNKSTGLIIVPRLMRVVCSNGMISSNFIGGYSIRHNQKLVEDFSEIIEKALNDMINSSSKLKAVLNNCMADSIEWKIAEVIMQRLIGRKNHVEAILEILKQNTKNSSGSLNRWDFYNALTQYATHGSQLKPSVEMWLQNKAMRVMDTSFTLLNETLPALEIPAN